MFLLNNKTAVVTGGGSGIGQEVCNVLAAQGATVYVLDLNAEHAHATAAAIENKGGSAKAIAIDVTDQAAMKKTYEAIEKIHLMVNCADFEKIFHVNVRGVYNSLFAGIPVMQKTGGGAIVNISSIVAKVGVADRFAYSMSKGAVHAMTLSVAKDFIKDGIRCNSISPGRVHTPFVDGFLKKNYPGQEPEMFEKLSKTQPIGRMGKPVEIAHQVLYLCSDEASFITGSDYSIDGGFTTLNS